MSLNNNFNNGQSKAARKTFKTCEPRILNKINFAKSQGFSDVVVTYPSFIKFFIDGWCKLHGYSLFSYTSYIPGYSHYEISWA